MNVSDNFLNLVDLILKVNNPMERQEYRQSLMEENREKLVELRLSHKTAFSAQPIYQSIIDRTQSYLTTLFSQNASLLSQLENKSYEIEEMKRIYASKQIFETDKINELFTIWDKNYITNDKNQMIEKQDGSTRFYMSEIESLRK